MNVAAHRRRHRLQPGINLTPMLDMIFNLIFFFILTSTVRDQTNQLEVNLPRSGSGSPVTQAEVIPLVSIQLDGVIVFKGRPMVEEELRLELFALARQGKTRLRLAADELVPYGRVVQVMDFCRTAGIKDVLWDFNPPAPSAPVRNRPAPDEGE